MDNVVAVFRSISEVIQTPFGVSLFMLAMLFAVCIALVQIIRHDRLDCQEARLEAREDSVRDAKMLSSALNVASKYHALILSLTEGPNGRRTPALATELANELRDLRRTMHDETQRRALRAAAARAELQQQRKKKFI